MVEVENLSFEEKTPLKESKFTFNFADRAQLTKERDDALQQVSKLTVDLAMLQLKFDHVSALLAAKEAEVVESKALIKTLNENHKDVIALFSRKV